MTAGAILTLALAGCTSADFRGADAGPGSDGRVDQSADMETDRGEVSTGQGGAGGIAEGTGGQPGTGGGTGTGTGGVAGTGGAPGTGGGSAGSSGSGGAGGDQDGGSSDALPDASLDAPTAVTPSAAGQLVITEIMADSDAASDDFGEWFEVYNPSAAVTVDLFKCVLADTANSHTVSRHVIIAPNSFATLARFGDISGGFVPDYNYNPTGCTSTCGTACPAGCPTVKFSNSGDKISVTCGATVIDAVDFSMPPWVTGMPLAVPHGHTYSLDPRHYDANENDMFANWCLGSKVYNSSGGTDYGSPGVSNPLCPSD